MATPEDEFKELVSKVRDITLETLLEEVDVPSLEDTFMVLVSVKAFVGEMVEVDSFSVDGRIVDVNASVEDTVPEVTFEDDSCSVVKTLYVEGATVVNGKLSDTVLVEVLVLIVAFVVELPVDWLFEDEEITTAGDVKEETFFAAVERLVPGDEIPLLLGSVDVVFDVVEAPVTGFAVDVELPTEVVPSVLPLTVVEPTLLALEFEFFTR